MPWGALIGIAGDIFGGITAQNGAAQAAKQDLTGYNYLTGANGVQGYVNSGNNANNTQNQLLGLAPMTAGASNGFQNYLNSTGYKFQLGQGTAALTGSAAARGILNSGATAKALTQYGQNLGSQYFSNYMNQIGDVANRGLTASGQIGQAGTTGGGNAGDATQNGANTMGKAIGGAAGAAGNAFGPQLTNWFGSL